MAGIVFPNIAESLLPIMQLQRSDAMMEFERARQRRLDDQYQREQQSQQYIPGALSGDQNALSELAKLNPTFALNVLNHQNQRADVQARLKISQQALDDSAANRQFVQQQKLSEQQRQQIKDAATYTANAATGLLALPEEEQPAAYATTVQQLKAQGYGKDLPDVWGPDAKRIVQFHAAQAGHYLDVLKQHEGEMGPLGPAAGTAAPAAGANPATDATAPAAAAPQAALSPPQPSTSDVINRASQASAGQESGGRYDALGPVANKAGDRAYGKYQVMGANIPSWTQEALGKPMTPQEFLANPQAQEAVYKLKFGQLLDKYGPEGAARAWFAGEGGMNNPNAKDVLGTTVAGYGQDFSRRFGGMGGVAPAGFNGLPSGIDFQGSPSMAPMPDAADIPPPALAGPSPLDLLRGIQLPPGARFVGNKAKGEPFVKEGNVLIQLADGTRTFIPMPQRNAPKEGGPQGPFAGNGLENQMMNILLTGDQSTPEYAAALAYVSKPRTAVDPASGQITVVPPMDTSMFRPSTYGGNAQPAGVAQAPAGAPPAAPAAPGAPSQAAAPAPAAAPLPANVTQTQIPGGNVVTQIQGHGRPIPGTENETISKNVQAINTIDKAIDVMKNPTADVQPSGRAAGFLSRNLGQTGDLIAQEIDPAGVKARALLADINSQLLLARSGAAVTEGEFKRLVALLPSAADNPDVIVQKLQQVRDTYAGILSGQAGQYTQKNGFIPHEGAQRILGGAKAAAPSAQAAPSAPPPTTAANGPRLSPEQAAQLPPGTSFVGMDGVPRVRH
ncbi:MAG TPA: hypothetical protein VF501_06705 [Thiobacillus sp.]